MQREFLPMLEDSITSLNWLWEPENRRRDRQPGSGPREWHDDPAPSARQSRRSQKVFERRVVATTPDRPRMLPTAPMRVARGYSGAACQVSYSRRSSMFRGLEAGWLADRLTDRVRGGIESKLTVISAPAGFGKSTLLAEWLARPTEARSPHGSRSMPVTTIPAYVLAAPDRGPPDGRSRDRGEVAGAPRVVPTRSIGRSSPPSSTSLMLSPHDLVLVLDDYHLIDSPDIQDGMAFLVDHLPDHVHLVIATRVDPALPLARLRARGDLIEVRAGDLRFTPDEAIAFLNGVMALGLTVEDVATLEVRTEGWIAAIHLAGISMQGTRRSAPDSSRGFAGDDRYIVDYLVEEVLQRQTEPVRTFLLQTSILDRLNGRSPTPSPAGRRQSDVGVARATEPAPHSPGRPARVVSLPPVFADVLQARLRSQRPSGRRRPPSTRDEWYEQNGERAEAIRHAMATGDFARAADLVELAMPETSRDRPEATLRRWLEALPTKWSGGRS